MKTGLTIEEMGAEILRQNQAKADYLIDTRRGSVTDSKGASVFRIRGTKLVIDNFYISRKDNFWERYRADVDQIQRCFFKALTHFEYGRYEISQKYGFLCDFHIDEKDGAYDKHFISSTIIVSIRVYKNGKVEIEFKDYNTALKFMDTYFPGLPQQASA